MCRGKGGRAADHARGVLSRAACSLSARSLPLGSEGTDAAQLLGVVCSAAGIPLESLSVGCKSNQREFILKKPLSLNCQEASIITDTCRFSHSAPVVRKLKSYL